MVKKKNIDPKYKLPKSFWLITGTVVSVIIFIIAGYMFWRTGWPTYISALNECDGRPPVRASSFITSVYDLPGDDTYTIPGKAGLISSTSYYCTEQEAQAAGYKHRLTPR